MEVFNHLQNYFFANHKKYQNGYLCGLIAEPIHFLGSLKANRSETPLTFQVHINPYGEIEIDFDKIVVTKKNSFIQDYLFNFGEFSLTGKADDGTELSMEKNHYWTFSVATAIP
jgi:hypothetical protein